MTHPSNSQVDSNKSEQLPNSNLGLNSVRDNIKKFNTGRRHSSFDPPQTFKQNFRFNTLDRGSKNDGNFNNNNFRTNTIGGYSKHSGNRTGCSSNYSNSNSDVGTTLQRAPYTSSCSNLLCDNDVKGAPSDASGGGINSNVPWKNHFSKLRRKSGSALLSSHGTTLEVANASTPRLSLVRI